MAQLIIIGLFFGIIFVLIVLAIWGSRKEKLRRKAIDFERDKIRELTRNDRLEIMIKLGLFINFMNEFMKTYEPTKGTISLGDVNKYGTELINNIWESESLRLIFKDSIRKEELREHIEALTKSKPSNWQTVSFDSFNILKAKINVILLNDEYKDFIEEIIKKNDSKFMLLPEKYLELNLNSLEGSLNNEMKRT